MLPLVACPVSPLATPSLLGRAGVGPVSLPTGEGWGGAVFPPYWGGLGWGFVSAGESALEMRGGRL